jgi:hypothetical protein
MCSGVGAAGGAGNAGTAALANADRVMPFRAADRSAPTDLTTQLLAEFVQMLQNSGASPLGGILA